MKVLVTDISELKPNDKIWSLNYGKLEIFQYLMPHPKAPNYSLMLNNEGDAPKFYNGILKNAPFYRFDGSDECKRDIREAQRDYYRNKVAFFENKLRYSK